MTNELREMALPIFLDAEEENEILGELAKEFSQEFFEELHDAFPDWITSPLTDAGPTKTLVMFLANTYPQDVFLLRDRDYFTKFRAKLYPPLASPFWRNIISAGQEPFEEQQREFLGLVREKMKKAGVV